MRLHALKYAQGKKIISNEIVAFPCLKMFNEVIFELVATIDIFYPFVPFIHA
jgi:hypothetical protein